MGWSRGPSGAEACGYCHPSEYNPSTGIDYIEDAIALDCQKQGTPRPYQGRNKGE